MEFLNSIFHVPLHTSTLYFHFTIFCLIFVCMGTHIKQECVLIPSASPPTLQIRDTKLQGKWVGLAGCVGVDRASQHYNMRDQDCIACPTMFGGTSLTMRLGCSNYLVWVQHSSQVWCMNNTHRLGYADIIALSTHGASHGVIIWISTYCAEDMASDCCSTT